MRLLIDVDALCKLAHWGLLEEIPSLMGIPLQECTTLASSKYRAIKAKSKLDMRVFHAVEAADRVLEAIALMQAPIEPAKDLGISKTCWASTPVRRCFSHRSWPRQIQGC